MFSEGLTSSGLAHAILAQQSAVRLSFRVVEPFHQEVDGILALAGIDFRRSFEALVHGRHDALGVDKAFFVEVGERFTKAAVIELWPRCLRRTDLEIQLAREGIASVLRGALNECLAAA